jgi:hypothetical protein
MVGATRAAVRVRPTVSHQAVAPELTPGEAQALLTCVREYFAILLEQRRLGDQMLSSAASRLYSAMLDAGVTPAKLE